MQPPIIQDLAISAVGGLVGGFFLGLFQWSVMRSKINRAGRWIWATSIGWATSVSSLPFVIISNFQATFPLTLTILALSVLIFPLAQWLVLRNEVQKAGWWILANVIGWVSAGITVTILVKIGLNEVVGLLIGFTLPGAIIGFALLYLFERPKVEVDKKALS